MEWHFIFGIYSISNNYISIYYSSIRGRSKWGNFFCNVCDQLFFTICNIRETPWTRIIEHKWFEFGKDEEGNTLPKTIISKEYSSEWKIGDEPYYPVNDEKNIGLYLKYKELADKEQKVIFGGRLGEYKYYDMDKTVESALEKSREIL